jgi:dihydrofolate reductase
MKRTYPIISAIAARSENGVIGHHNQIPWHLPVDLKHFKTITTGHPVIMGRKTFESIGKPLPNRTNIILTRNTAFNAPGCMIVNSTEQAILQASSTHTDEMFIMGGADIYQLFMPKIQKLYLTLVHHTFAGDTFFPSLDPNQWVEIEKRTYPADPNNPYNYSFVIWERKPTSSKTV